MEPAPESPRFKGVLSSRPFELGKPVAKTSVGDDTVEEKSPFGVTAVKVGTIESLNFPVSSKSEPETKQKEFEWGRPLLGGSSDEEDYEEEEDSDGKTVVFESAAPVYLEKEPGEVSIPLHSSVDKSVNPDKEVIEEYVDQEGRQVKRISKLTTTKTITRVERQTPIQEMDIDVPSEPKEDIEEYTDEHGQRVRRVVRTSFTTTTKTVLRDGSVKVVLKPDDLGDGELKEGPEDVENIVTSTSEDGRRAQKLSKSTFTTQLKGRLQPVAVEFPSTQEDDQPPSSSQTEDENEKSPVIRERKRTDPPEGPSEVPEIPRKRVHKEISIVSKSDVLSPTSPIAQDGGVRMEIEDEEGRDEESEDEDFDEFDEEIVVVEMKKHPRVPKWFVAVPGEPGEPVKAEGLDYLPKITTLVPHAVERPEVKENVFCVSVERKVTIPELSSPYDEISQSKLLPTKTDDQSPKGVDETKDDWGTKVFESAAPVYLDLYSPEIDRTEGESPEEVEEYVDENGVRVKRIVRRVVTTTTINRESHLTKPVQVEFAHTDDESPEEVEEYIDENGMRVKRIVRRTITNTTIRREGQQIEPVESEFPAADVAHIEDGTPEEEVEEYVDENGVRVKRVVRRTITTATKTIKREGQQVEPVEVKFPVAHTDDESPEEMEEYIDENGVRVKRIVKRVVTTTSIKREDQQIEPVEIEFPVASTKDESPEEVEEYIDENGVRVKRIVKRVVTTTSIKREDQQIEPVEIEFPVASTKDESPEEVEEYIDENGVRVKRIVKRVVTTTSINRESHLTKPVEIEFAAAHTDDESPEEVEEYIDENGMRVRRIVRRTITNTTIRREGQQIEPLEIEFPAAEVAHIEDGTPEEEVEEYVDENGVRVKRVVRRTITTATKTIKREGQQVEPVEVKFPVAHTDDESPEEVEEYIDENGVRVKRIVKRVVTTTSIKREDQQIEPVEIEFPVAHTEDESPEEVEEYIDENGVRVKRIVKRVVTTTSIKREGQQIEPVEIEFPVAYTEDESPEEVEEYIDENGVHVRRIVRRTITTKSVIRTSGDEGKDNLGTKVFESAAPVYLETDSEDVAPSVQIRKVVVPEWMEESEPQSREPKQHSGDTSVSILPYQPAIPEAKEDRERYDVMESVTATTLNQEIVIPEIDGMEDTSPEEVEEYVDENGVRVRRIVKRVVTTATIKRPGKDVEPTTAEIPIAHTEGETPDEVEEYVDENGVRVRRIIKRTITTTSIRRQDERVEPTVIEFPVAHTEDETPEQVEEYTDENGVRVRRIIKRTITTTSTRRQSEKVEPTPIELPVARTEDETPEEVEEYIDENGVRVRRIIKRTITTTSIRRQGEEVEPTAIEFPVAHTEDEAPEEVEEYTDENGVRVRRIIKRTITTTSTRRQGEKVEPTAIELPVARTEDEAPEEFEEYIDEHGVRIKRVVTRTITRTVHQRSTEGTIGMHKVVEEVAPSEETETVETVAPESATFSQTELTSSRRVSIPYKTTVVQRYLVIIETLYQYVLEHKSMIFIYSSRHMRFSFVLENFLQWMLVTLKKLSWMRPVSWKVDEIKMQLQEIKVLLSDGVFVDVHDGFNVIGGNLHEHCMPHKIAWCM